MQYDLCSLQSHNIGVLQQSKKNIMGRISQTLPRHKSCKVLHRSRMPLRTSVGRKNGWINDTKQSQTMHLFETSKSKVAVTKHVFLYDVIFTCLGCWHLACSAVLKGCQSFRNFVFGYANSLQQTT